MNNPAANPWAVILAAGSGTRLATALTGAMSGVRKQDLVLDGAPLWWASARTLARLPGLAGVVLVFPPDETQAREAAVAELDRAHPLGLPWRIAGGGQRRQDSVRKGVDALPRECGWVLVHDAARPFVSASLAQRVLDALVEHPAPCVAVIPAVPVKDTIKKVVDGLVRETPDRSRLMAVQTPQGFTVAPLKAAHERAEAEGWQVTDDAMLMERAGHPVAVVDGEEGNVKITTPEDLALIRSAQPAPGRMLPRTGWGYDVHKYLSVDTPENSPNARPLVLGGVPIPGGPKVAAHSDGDVLLHALTDALLGLVCAGDIGTLFPDSDPANEGLESGVFVKEAAERCARAGIVLTHVDLTVIAQVPKLSPHRQAMAKNVARLLELDPASVNCKATTEEGLGFTGEKQGLKAVACVTALGPAPASLSAEITNDPASDIPIPTPSAVSGTPGGEHE